MAKYQGGRLLSFADSQKAIGIVICIAYTFALPAAYVLFHLTVGALADGFHTFAQGLLHHAPEAASVPTQRPVDNTPIFFFGWGIVGFLLGLSKAQTYFLEAQKILWMVQTEEHLSSIRKALDGRPDKLDKHLG